MSDPSLRGLPVDSTLLAKLGLEELVADARAIVSASASLPEDCLLSIQE